DAAAVTGLADSNPPPRFANYVLARVAMLRKDWRTAANRFEREGLAFPSERQRDLRRAITIWIDHNAWNEVRRSVRDPRFDSALDASLRLDIATHERDWLRILVWIWPAGFVHWNAWPIVLFLPLVPALLRRGSRIEAMTCGALVGLGFAAEENIGYFHRFGAQATLPRFLTANFFHMSLTAVVALSVFDTLRGRATSR